MFQFPTVVSSSPLDRAEAVETAFANDDIGGPNNISKILETCRSMSKNEQKLPPRVLTERNSHGVRFHTKAMP
jgi:hypothetical protein